MIIFPIGLVLFEAEHKCLLHLVVDPEQWVLGRIVEKAKSRRRALELEWESRLRGDPDTHTIPVDDSELAQLIMSRPEYKDRVQRETELPLGVPNNAARFEGRTARVDNGVQRGLVRISSAATITMFPDGIDIADFDYTCIMAYVYSLEDWIMGAILGHITKGKTEMIAQYRNDPAVTTIPVDEGEPIGELIQVITGQSDYETIPGRFARIIREKEELEREREEARLEMLRLETIRLAELEAGP